MASRDSRRKDLDSDYPYQPRTPREESHPQRCHWAKDTPRRCQMLGTMGYGDGKGGMWFCTLHYFESHGQHRLELQSFEALLPWLLQVGRQYPGCQWNEDPQLIWERLHGRADGPKPYQQPRPAPGDGEIPTREELDKILSRLKPGLWAKTIRNALPRHMVSEEPQADEVSPTDDALAVARSQREAQLAQARARGLIP